MMEFRVFRAIGLAFKSWFRNFIPFTILIALLFAPSIAMIATSTPEHASSAEKAINSTMMYPYYVFALLSTLLAPMLTYRVIQELNGNKVSMLTSVKYGFRGILPALVAGVVYGILGFIPLGFIIQLVLMCIWFVAGPAAVGEKLGPLAALSRSAELTRGRRWGIFGIVLLMILAGILMGVALVMPLMSRGSESLGNLKTLAYQFVILMGLFQVFMSIVQAVSYALLRSDKDGMTHEQLASVFD